MQDKPKDCHQFLHFNSAHPFHNKKSIFTARDSVSKGSVHLHELSTNPLKTRFCKRGYPYKVVDAQIKRVSEKSLDELFERPDRKETGVPLVVTYHPRLHNLSAIMRKYFTFLYAEEKVKRVFTPAPFVSFPSGYSLRNHLVRAKVYPLFRKKVHFVVEKADVNLVQHKTN